MSKTYLAILGIAVSSAAFATTATYSFAPDWNGQDNNDQNKQSTGKPYTEKEIKSFLDTSKDKNAIGTGPRALYACGEIEVKKGCHMDSEGRHVTFYVDGRKNRTAACQPFTNASHHAYGC